MFEDHNTLKLIKNAFRISKVRGESAIRVRVPGGHLEAKHLAVIQALAEKFGNGTVHMTTRQGFEIPGVKLSDLIEAKKFMARMIADIETQSKVVLEDPQEGYPSVGSRNVCACIGNRVCTFANADTTALAQKIEGVIYPNDLHLKVAVTGCPNDCIKAHMHDIGIISTTLPEYDRGKCILCEACVDTCRQKVTNALRLENSSVEWGDDYCIRCGECILQCPTGAWKRVNKLYRIIIGGRTGKKNPRLANTFIFDASEEVVLGVCKNLLAFAQKHIDRSLPKEHVGYIIDRAGAEVFAEEVLGGIALNPEAKVEKIANPGYKYKRRKDIEAK